MRHTISATSTLVNTDVERAQMRGNDEDPLPKNMDRLFTVLEKELQLVSLPTFKPEHARTRLTQLIGQRESLDEDQESSMDRM